MILVSRLSGETFYLNSNLIETIEETPDTVIKLVNDKTLIVKEKVPVVIERIIEYNRKIFAERTRTE